MSSLREELDRVVDTLPEEQLAELLADARYRAGQAALAAGQTDPDQAWFWTPEWQAKEREADVDIALGRTIRFNSDEEFDTWLANN